MTVSGRNKFRIKEWFDCSVTRLADGVWTLPDGPEGSIVSGFGEGLCFDANAVVVCGDAKWRPPLDIAKALSAQHPDLSITISGDNPWLDHYELWEFKGGVARLLECVEGERDQETVFVRHGKQLSKLPLWLHLEDESSLPEAAGCELSVQ